MKKNRAKRLSPGFKLWMNSEDVRGVFGDGKWRLLKAVESQGSLQAACDLLGISYRKAWGDLKKAEQQLGVELVEKRRGGSKGGTTSLTAEGRKWLKAYAKFRGEMEKTMNESYDKYIREIVGD